MPGPGFPNLPPPFTRPPTPFRPVDVHGNPGPGSQSSAARPTGQSWYVRVGGSNNNGGSDTSLTPLRTGTDGSSTSGLATFTSATGAFTSADVGRGLCIQTGTNARRFKITGILSSTQVTIDRADVATGGGQTWAIGGAWADVRAAVGDSAVTSGSSTKSGVVGGDTVWIGAGIYRIAVTPGSTFVPTSQVNIQGDVSGVHTGDPGMVMHTAYTTDDRTTPISSALLVLNGFGGSNLLFANLVLVGPTSANIISGGGSTNLSFVNCSLLGAGNMGNTIASFTPAFGVASNILFDGCIIANQSTGLQFSLGTGVGGNDYDVGILIRNCVFLGITGTRVSVLATGANAKRGGGIRVINCSVPVAASGSFVNVGNANVSITIPCVVYGCYIAASTAGLTANTQGQIVEDWNVFAGNVTRTNVTAGSHTTTTYAPLVHIGQELFWGGTLRPSGEPMQVSPVRAFGALNTDGGALDIRGVPRPSNTPQWDAGAYQRGNTAVQETVVVQAGSNAIKVTGFGTQDFDVPVDATATALSIWVRYDSNYVGPLPQIQVVKAQGVGVGDYTVPVSMNSLNAYAQYTIPLINPTGAGIVTLRVVSGDTSGVGIVYADAFSVS